MKSKETISVSKEFVLEAHKAACEGWQKRIEKEFPELFKNKLEVGKWYNSDGNGLLCFTGDKAACYGFWIGRWGDDWEIENNATPAKDKEVEVALITEAEKRGFKEGVRFELIEGVIGSATYFERGWEYKYEPDKNRLVIERQDGRVLYTIFRDGKWAEIIDDKSELKERVEQLEKELKEIKSQL